MDVKRKYVGVRISLTKVFQIIPLREIFASQYKSARRKISKGKSSPSSKARERTREREIGKESEREREKIEREREKKGRERRERERVEVPKRRTTREFFSNSKGRQTQKLSNAIFHPITFTLMRQACSREKYRASHGDTFSRRGRIKRLLRYEG